METRICIKCGILKPLVEFKKQGKWYSNTCKECHKVKQKEYNDLYYKKYSEQIKQHQKDKRFNEKINSEKYIKKQELINKGLKICSKCGLEKPLSDFYKDKHKSSGYKSSCIECEMKRREPFKNKEFALKQEEAKKLLEQGLKKCTRCNQIKELSEYSKDKSSNNGYRATCKQCDKEYMQSEQGKISQKKSQEKYRKSENGKKKRAEALARYNLTEKGKATYLRYYKSEKKRITRNKYISDRMENDILFRFENQVRHLINHSIERKGYKKNSRTFEIIGIPFDQFYSYLLQTYKKNYGVEWDGIEPVHIDHIVPLATAKTEDEVIKLCYYTNLQLLRAQDNLEKHDRLDWKVR